LLLPIAVELALLQDAAKRALGADVDALSRQLGYGLFRAQIAVCRLIHEPHHLVLFGLAELMRWRRARASSCVFSRPSLPALHRPSRDAEDLARGPPPDSLPDCALDERSDFLS